MVIVLVILGFIAGIGVGGGIVAGALTDPLGAAYWSLVKRHSTIGLRARLCLIACFLSQPAASCSHTRDTRWSRLKSLAARRPPPPPPSGAMRERHARSHATSPR